ncbi:hypothetical protein HGA91_05910 [candidate division WWE3 bacterium]|nr:hypothetical protein [candidate division WWE3 bacterium]
MNKFKRKKNTKIEVKHKSQFLLENTIQIRKLWDKNVQDEIARLKDQGELYSSHYVLYEYKTGFIGSLIKFHSLLRIERDVSRAFGLLSNKHGRIQNYTNILTSLWTKVHGSISTDYENALADVEVIIEWALVAFMGDVKKLVGNFSQNEVVKYNLKGITDFKEYENICKDNTFVNLKDFFQQHKPHFNAIIEFLNKNPKTLKQNQQLPRIKESIEEIFNNLDKADRHNPSRGIADAVIAIDAPIGQTIVTTDTAYPVLCAALNKPHELWRFKN